MMAKNKRPSWRAPFVQKVLDALRAQKHVSLECAIAQTTNPLESFCVLVAYKAVKRHHPNNFYQLQMVGSFIKRVDMAYDLFAGRM